MGTLSASPAVNLELNLRHVRAELARIDLLIGRESRLWQLAGQDPGDHFRGLHIPAGEVQALLERPFASSWGQSVVLDAEDAQAYSSALAVACEQIETVVREIHHLGQISRLEHLTQTFGLTRFDLDALLICLAPLLDLRYERLYAYLQDDVTCKHPTVNLILDLLCAGDPEFRLRHLSRFSDDAPLFRYHLLEEPSGSSPSPSLLLSQTLTVDPAIRTWLLGKYRPHADLGAATILQPSAESGSDTLLAAEVWPQIERHLTISQEGNASLDWPVFVFHGPDPVSQRAAARLLAVRTGRPLLIVDLAVLVDGALPDQSLKLALRDARLTGALLCLEGWDACLQPVERSSDHAENLRSTGREHCGPLPGLVAQLCAHNGPIIVLGRSVWQATGLDRSRPLFWFECPMPSFTQRQALWRHYLRQVGAAGQGRDLDLLALAGQFQLTTSQIRDAVATGRDRATQRGDEVRLGDLLAAARAHSNQSLTSLARKIEPRYRWEDIVLPQDQLAQLQELVMTVRQRPLVLEEWGVGRKLASSSGVTALFSGPPGTGKTMAAEVIAADLGLDLFRIDLSTMVSKYIGETEKNLEKIFSEAQSSNAILFFDEADAIFGKRSEVKDAHDRYANIEISYLLQRMEVYDGVTILATNLRANLDEAFTRRLQFAVDFPFPDERYRLRIWKTLFPPGVPRREDLDFELFADRFRLAGGNIRNILVGAAYLAAADGGVVEMKHLLHATRRELQKMGRLVNERDLLLGGDHA